MARNLTDGQKKSLRKKIREEIKAVTFVRRAFCAENKISDRTMERLIKQNASLQKLYMKYRTEQDTKKKYNKKNKKSNDKKDGPKEYQGEEVIKDFSEKKGVVTTRSLNIKTVPELLKVAEVDTDIWEVDRSLINTWEVTVGGIKTGTGQCETFTNYQVKVWLKRTSPAVDALKDLYEKIKVASPIVPIIARGSTVDDKKKIIKRELEVSLMDIHLGMRTFKPESERDWSPDEAEIMTMEILEKLLIDSRKYGPFERIVFPMGNDFLHTDNCFNTTTAGTFQPEADAWKHNFLRGELLGLAIMDRLIKEAPVKVIAVPGNHAQHSEIALSRILNAYYRNNDNFEIDASMAPFKFHDYGVNLLGFEHGHSIRQQIRLAALMANETRLDGVWEKARYCEWHCGDQHRKGSGKPMQFEELGVSIEFLPGLVPPNEWHKLHAFCWQKRAGMAFVWDKTAGPIARLQVNVDSYSGKVMV